MSIVHRRLAAFLAASLASTFVFAACASPAAPSGPAASAPAPAQPAPAKTITIRFGTTDQLTSPVTQSAVKMADLVKERTKGAVNIEVYPNNQIGTETELLQGVQTGSIDGAQLSVAILATLLDQYNAMSLPFVFSDYPQAYKVLDGPIGEQLLGLTTSRNFVGLAWGDMGMRQNVLKKNAKTLADLKGLKMRTIQSPIFVSAFQAWGISAVPLASSEIYTAMQTGVVDGFDAGWEMMKLQKAWEVAKYVLATNQHFMAFIDTISKPAWDKLTPEQQKTVKDAALEGARYGRNMARQQEDKTIAELKSYGLTVNETDTTEMRQASMKVWDEYKAKIGDQLYKDLQAAMKK